MNKREARAHWESHVAEWTAWAENFKARVLAIEDPILQFAVAAIVDTVASGYGNVAIRRLSDTKIAADGFFLDDEVTEAIQVQLREKRAADPDRVMLDADRWIRGHFNVSILTIAWAFRHFQNRNILAKDQYRTIEHHGILFSVGESRFIGVRYDGGIWKVPR